MLNLSADRISITVERAVEATHEVRDLIEELNEVLGAAYEAHQRHGLSIEQLFEPHVRFFIARLDGLAVGCGGVAVFDDYAEVKRMYTRPMARGRGVAKALLRRIEDEARGAGICGLAPGNGNPAARGDRSLSANGVSTARSVRRVCGNACPQHRDELVLRRPFRSSSD